MNLREFAQLKKLMMLAASPNDAEALGALRRATAILVANGYTWEQALSRTINVIADVEGEIVIERGQPTIKSGQESRILSSLIQDAEEAAEAQSSDTQAFVADVSRQFRARGSLSPKQIALLENVRDR